MKTSMTDKSIHWGRLFSFVLCCCQNDNKADDQPLIIEVQQHAAAPGDSAKISDIPLDARCVTTSLPEISSAEQNDNKAEDQPLIIEVQRSVASDDVKIPDVLINTRNSVPPMPPKNTTLIKIIKKIDVYTNVSSSLQDKINAAISIVSIIQTTKQKNFTINNETLSSAEIQEKHINIALNLADDAIESKKTKIKVLLRLSCVLAKKNKDEAEKNKDEAEEYLRKATQLIGEDMEKYKECMQKHEEYIAAIQNKLIDSHSTESSVTDISSLPSFSMPE